MRPRGSIHEEHSEDARVHANVDVAHRTYSTYKGGIRAAYRHVLDGEILQVQVGSHVIFREQVLWQEVERGNFETRGDDDDVGRQIRLLTGVFGLGTPLTLVEADCIRSQRLDISANVVGAALADVRECRRVDNGRA